MPAATPRAVAGRFWAVLGDAAAPRERRPAERFRVTGNGFQNPKEIAQIRPL